MIGHPKPGKKSKKSTAIPLSIVKAVLIRDKHICQYTGKPYKPEQHALHVHHRVFKKMGRTKAVFNMLDNLASCDWEKHQDHGSLKHARILSEGDDNSKINELEERYK